MKATEFLANLAKQLNEQDNVCTSLPIYTVQEEVRIVGIDPDYTDSRLWIDDADSEIVNDDNRDDGEPTNAQLDAMWDNGDDTDGYTRTGYIDQWEMRESFLTMDAAKDYIAGNSHRHRGALRVYVESAHRNPEMRELRRLLAGPVSECVAALAEVTAELRQLHAHHYASCKGGCPADAYLQRADAALESLDTFVDPFK